MKIAIYAETSLLESIALGHDLKYASIYSLHVVLGDAARPEGMWLCGEMELNLPSRDIAVQWAAKAIQLEAIRQAMYYEERLAKLLSLTWEPPQ